MAVMAYLSGADKAAFADLKRQTAVTDGNLSANLRKLEDAGYVAIDKSFVDRRPMTRVTLTPQGREAWIAYLGNLEQLLGLSQP